MAQLPVYSTTYLLDKLPVRISTLSTRSQNNYHFHRHIQLCFVMSGSAKYIISGKEYIGEAGSCAFILPYIPHSISTVNSEDTPTLVYVWFYENFLKGRGYSLFTYGDFFNFNGYAIPTICPFSNSRETVKKLFRDLINEFMEQEAPSFDKIASLIADVFTLACSQKVSNSMPHLFPRQFAGIERAVSYIIQNYSSKIKVEHLSQLAEMSVRSFSEHFKKITKLTPAQFVLAVRINHATCLLLNTEEKFDVIAKDVGLHDYSNLSRIFVKYLGSTPSQYREMLFYDTRIEYEIPINKRYAWLISE